MPAPVMPDGPDDPRQFVRIAVDLPDNLKMNATADPIAAIAASVIAICISAKGLTDGHVPTNSLRRAGIDSTVIKELIAEGVWHDEHHTCTRCDTPRPGFFYIHDYLRHQRSSSYVRELRAKRSAAGAAGAAQRWAGSRAKQAAAREAAEAKAAETKAAKEAAPAPAQAEEPLSPKEAKKAELRADAIRLCDYLASWIERNHSKGQRPSVGDAWINDMRKLIDIDGHTVDEVREVIRWTQTHHFWNDKVRSPFKLRKQIKGDNDLIGKMRKERGQTSSGKPAGRAAKAMSLAARLDAGLAVEPGSVKEIGA